MAIPGVPQNFYVQQGNREVYLSWDIQAGATSYQVQRSTDGVNFSNLFAPTINNYLDDTVVSGTMYWYQIASVNGSGTSPYTTAQNIVPAPTAEMSLLQLRQMSQQKADRVNSNFVTLPEWNNFIDLAMYELYDLLITADEEYFVADPIQFPTVANQSVYPLPDGALTFTNGNTGSTFTAPSFYKFKGQDLNLNTSSNAFVTVNKFNFIDRNTFIYPNTTSTIYGVFNLQYRLQGNNIKFIPTPTANQILQVWYIPRLSKLLKDTDITTIGYSGWLQYVITRAAKYALDKEESDTSKLDAEILFLKERIEGTAVNRDMGLPDTISNTRRSGSYGRDGGGWGFNGPTGGM